MEWKEVSAHVKRVCWCRAQFPSGVQGHLPLYLGQFSDEPLGSLLFWLAGMRNMSAVYIIFGTATAMKKHLMYLAGMPLYVLASLWYCVTHFTPFCSAWCACSFHCSSWSSSTLRNLWVATTGTLLPYRKIGHLFT